MSVEVVVVGSLNADRTLYVHEWPGPGETVMAADSLAGFGGKGANQAVAAAKAGGSVAMIGRVGDDSIGREMLADLRQQGVDVSRVRTQAGSPSGSATVVVSLAGGDNFIIVDPGANAAVEPKDLDPWPVAGAAVVLLQLEVPIETVASAAQRSSALLVLNPAPARHLSADLLRHVDVLIPNARELAAVTGGPLPSSIEEAASLAGSLTDVPVVIVTMGAAGVVIRSRERGRSTHIVAPRVATVDTTGAGDCFCGVFAVESARGATVEEATRLAVAAASLSTMGHGARGALPTRDAAAKLAMQLGQFPL